MVKDQVEYSLYSLRDAKEWQGAVRRILITINRVYMGTHVRTHANRPPSGSGDRNHGI